MGEVIHFPLQRTCFACVHHRLGWDSASHCALFDESILSELAAARDCNGFEHE